jgi:hypothetical protein
MNKSFPAGRRHLRLRQPQPIGRIAAQAKGFESFNVWMA